MDLPLALLAAALLTGLTVLGSTLFSTLANGIGVFVLYGLGFTGGILSAIGTLADTPTLTTLGRAGALEAAASPRASGKPRPRWAAKAGC